MPVGDIYRVNYRCQLRDQHGINVVHYRTKAEVGVGVTAAAIIAALYTRVLSTYTGLLSAEAVFLPPTIQQVYPPPTKLPFTHTASNVTGGILGNAAPPQTCGLVSFTTAFAGRDFRGRIYIPFPGAADVSSTGQPISTYLSRLISLGNAVVAPLTVTNAGNSVDMEACIYHRKTPGNPTTINGVIARLGYATQRRRSFFGAVNVTTGT